MGNLGGYQDITTAAKAVGGPDNLIAIIESAAVKRAAPGHRGQGAALAVVALVAGAAAKQRWDKYQAGRAAESGARADEAKAQLKDLIGQRETEACAADGDDADRAVSDHEVSEDGGG